MRMVLPGVRSRRAIDKRLQAFFADYRERDFRRAISALSRFYRLPPPRVQWFEYLGWGRTGGYTYDNGEIHLVHPENWKRGRKYNSERHWINTVYHEMGHYVFWANAERKAIMFACRMVRRLRGPKAARGVCRSGTSRTTGTTRGAATRRAALSKAKKTVKRKKA